MTFLKTTKLSEQVAIVITEENNQYHFGYCDKSSGNYEWFSDFYTTRLKTAEKAYEKEIKHQFS